MYAHLRPYYALGGGTLILSDVYRYAGCIAGFRGAVLIGRPILEFDALSHDGTDWKPLIELLIFVRWETP